MPMYEYECEKGHRTSASMAINAIKPTTIDCEQCGKRAARVFSPPALRFKGSGFFSTDYGGAHR